jgi:hypothetical protein
LWEKHHLAVGERSKEDGGQESIFSKEKQILLMESLHVALTVLVYNLRFDDEWNPVVVRAFPCLQPIHGETSGQASDTTKDRFKGFGQVMRDEVLEYLDGGHP